MKYDLFTRVLIIIFGFTIIIIGLLLGSIKNSKGNYVQTPAKVIEVKKEIINNKEIYYPTLEYIIRNEPIQNNSIVSTNDPTKYRKGDIITIYYNRNNVENITVKKPIIINIQSIKHAFPLIVLGLQIIIVLGLLGKVH